MGVCHLDSPSSWLSELIIGLTVQLVQLGLRLSQLVLGAASTRAGSARAGSAYSYYRYQQRQAPRPCQPCAPLPALALKWLFFLLDLSMVDRQLHDDLQKIYLHLKAPRFDLHRPTLRAAAGAHAQRAGLAAAWPSAPWRDPVTLA